MASKGYSPHREFSLVVNSWSMVVTAVVQGLVWFRTSVIAASVTNPGQAGDSREGQTSRLEWGSYSVDCLLLARPSRWRSDHGVSCQRKWVYDDWVGRRYRSLRHSTLVLTCRFEPSAALPTSEHQTGLVRRSAAVNALVFVGCQSRPGPVRPQVDRSSGLCGRCIPSGSGHDPRCR